MFKKKEKPKSVTTVEMKELNPKEPTKSFSTANLTQKHRADIVTPGQVFASTMGLNTYSFPKSPGTNLNPINYLFIQLILQHMVKEDPIPKGLLKGLLNKVDASFALFQEDFKAYLHILEKSYKLYGGPHIFTQLQALMENAELFTNQQRSVAHDHVLALVNRLYDFLWWKLSDAIHEITVYTP